MARITERLDRIEKELNLPPLSPAVAEAEPAPVAAEQTAADEAETPASQPDTAVPGDSTEVETATADETEKETR